MMLSRFLPSGFDAARPVAIMAGRGDYPLLMHEGMKRAGVDMRLIVVEGETEQELIDKFPAEQLRSVKVGQVGKLLRHLETMGCGYAMMVGQIRPARLFKGLHLDLKALDLWRKLKTRNAETLYGAVVDAMKSIGVECLDTRAFMEEHLAFPGIMTGGELRIPDFVLEHGIQIAREIARLDIGQGVVVRKGTILCVEEFDGTDAMLRRAARFKTTGKLFVKTVKPNQNFAIDVPVFGETTIQSMQEGGIRFAALSSESTILLRRERVLELARKAKIQLIGFEVGENLRGAAEN